MSEPIPRLVPDEALPPYAYVPGRFPHPISDPAGHRFGAGLAAGTAVDPEQWQECRLYLLGFDLFNRGYYWESHVAWENLWLACGRKGVTADFLKGLIKLAAAGVKALEGTPAGVKSHGGRGCATLARGEPASGAAGRFLGLARRGSGCHGGGHCRTRLAGPAAGSSPGNVAAFRKREF